MKKYQSFSEFYPFYLSQHQHPICIKLHYVGSCVALASLFYALFSSQFIFVFFALVSGYSFAWIGHFFFEKNKPATFNYPLYSFMGDWVMFYQAITGKKSS
jgi:hypothetical protein